MARGQTSQSADLRGVAGNGYEAVRSGITAVALDREGGIENRIRDGEYDPEPLMRFTVEGIYEGVGRALQGVPMIHYHGGPITPQSAALNAWKGAHAMISFAHPEQLELAAEVCQSFALDNGAFSKWRSGEEIDSTAFDAWVKEWMRHPGFDFYIIPDVIDGDEKENDAAICHYHSHPPFHKHGVPVWHLHETITRLKRLATTFDMVALGSSGEWATPGTDGWWKRMAEAMDAVCDGAGRPICKLHGLRMLDPTIFSHLPLASADSCNIARNIGIDSAWNGPYLNGLSKEARAMVLRERIESHGSAATWNRESHGVQMNWQLVG